MLLGPGRGPLRPRVEEAGKEDRRRERGMIHPEELELETLQPGNSLARADGRAGGSSPCRAPCPAPAAPCPRPPALATARTLGEGRPLQLGLESHPGQSLPLVVVRTVFPESSSSLSCCSFSAG